MNYYDLKELNRLKKLDEVKAMVAAGRYDVGGEAVADKMIRHAVEVEKVREAIKRMRENPHFSTELSDETQKLVRQNAMQARHEQEVSVQSISSIKQVMAGVRFVTLCFLGALAVWACAVLVLIGGGR